MQRFARSSALTSALAAAAVVGSSSAAAPSPSCSTGAANITSSQKSSLFTTTRARLGLEQLIDVPSSSHRKPRGRHAGPGKRAMNKGEIESYKFIKKWEMQMNLTWDPYESFKGQPKPKKQFGNEACEVIWPYALLLENTINIHRFTKSIYVYYPQRQETRDGTFAAAVAKRFSHQYLIPITFHNSQCYVETEMLVEYGEVPWVVIHCLDGKHAVLPIKAKAPASENNASRNSSSSVASSSSSSSSASSSSGKDGASGHASSDAIASAATTEQYTFSPLDIKEAAENLLNEVVSKAEELGNAVSDVSATLTALHDRPLQNQYLRINYQWFGDTQEERSSHLVRWNFDMAKVVPPTSHRHTDIRDRLNFGGGYPLSQNLKTHQLAEKNRVLRTGDRTGAAAMRTGQAKRQNARYSKAGGSSQSF